MKLHAPLTFDWDEGNQDKNLNKHGVHYREIEEVFFNRPVKIFPDIGHSQIERRFLAYGKTNSGDLLLVVFTIRDQKLRVISARRQNKKERYIYET